MEVGFKDDVSDLAFFTLGAPKALVSGGRFKAAFLKNSVAASLAEAPAAVGLP